VTRFTAIAMLSYRYRDAVEDGGVEALLERPRRSPNLKNRVDL